MFDKRDNVKNIRVLYGRLSEINDPSKPTKTFTKYRKFQIIPYLYPPGDDVVVKTGKKLPVEIDSLAYIKYNCVDPIVMSHLRMSINIGVVPLVFKNFFSTKYEVSYNKVWYPPRRFGKCVCPNCCDYYGHRYTISGKMRTFKLPDITFCPGFVRTRIRTKLLGNYHCINAVENYYSAGSDIIGGNMHSFYDIRRVQANTAHLELTTKTVPERRNFYPRYQFHKGVFCHRNKKFECISWSPRKPRSPNILIL